MALKNKKSKYVPAKIMAGVAAICFTGLIYHCIAHGVTQDKMNAMTRDIISTQEFVNYKVARTADYYDAYKKGIITAREFDERTKAITSGEEVFKNREHFMTAEDSEKYLAIREKDEGLETGAIACGGAAIFSVVGTGACIIAEEDKRRKYAEFHSMDLC